MIGRPRLALVERWMSRSRFGFRGARPLIGVLALGLHLLCGLAPASAADTRSSPEDRARFVSITRTLEEAPLNPSLKPDFEWALSWLTDAPDVSVSACLTTLGGLPQSNYPYAGEIVLQYIFSMGAFVIEHPEAANDANAQQLAGAEGALHTYGSILRDKPDAKSPDLEALREVRARGELPDYVREALISCAAKK
jgi:hypothetical protein